MIKPFQKNFLKEFKSFTTTTRKPKEKKRENLTKSQINRKNKQVKYGSNN